MERQIFSNNRKISTRQIRRTMTLEMLGVSSLALPAFLAKTSGMDGIFALILGAAGAACFLKLWKHFTGRQNFFQALEGCRPAGQLAISFFYGGVFLGISAYILFLLTRVMREQLLNVKYEPLILLTLTAAGVFGVLKGIESRVRIYEVLFWFLIAPLVMILGLASVSVNPGYWTPVFAAEKTAFVKSAYVCFAFFSFSSLFLLFEPHCSKPGRAIKGVRAGLLIVLILDAAIYLILAGIFQTGLLSELSFPIITLMAVVKLPGEFFERQDAFMTAIWFFCLFSLYNSMLFYGKEMLQNGVRACLAGKGGRAESRQSGKGKALTPDWRSGQTGWVNSIWACACGAVILAAAVCFLRTEILASGILKIFLQFIFPVIILLPIPVFLIGGRKEGGR